MTEQHLSTRRSLLISVTRIAGGLALAPLLNIGGADATPDEMQVAIRKVVGEATITPGKVQLDIPPLVENGNSVPLTVTVESPMTPADHVKAIHVFNEKNPQPNVASFRLTPRCGRPIVSTRARIADTQKIIAIAEMSDGTFWSDSADVIVTLAACLEEL